MDEYHLMDDGINGLIQNIDIIDDCGHYDHDEFPWHSQMIDNRCEALDQLIPTLSIEKRIDIVLGLSRVPVKPVTRLIDTCLEGITREQFALCAMKFYLDMEFCETMAQTGAAFLTESDRTSLMICHYMLKSDIEITAANIRDEIAAISKTILKDAKLPDQMFLGCVTKVGLTDVHIDTIKMVRKFQIPTVTSHDTETETDQGYHIYRNHSEKIGVKGGQLHMQCVNIVFPNKSTRGVYVGVDKDNDVEKIDAELTFTILLVG